MPYLRLGILSTAQINRRCIIHVVPHLKNVRLLAVASRDNAKASDYRSKYNIPKSYGTYEELLDDPELDAVYISLPNALHTDYTIQALTRGKHVLCEKPISSNPPKALLIEEIAKTKKLYVAEAMHYRHHPAIRKAVTEIHSGIIGEIENIDISFVWDLRNPQDVRLDSALEGGALMDVGCYCLNFIRWLTGDDEPVFGEVTAEFSGSNVDTSITCTLLCSGKIPAKFHCDLRAESFDCRAEIAGTKGSVLLRYPFLPVIADSGTARILFESRINNQAWNIDVPPKTSYFYQLEDFGNKFQNGFFKTFSARTDFYYNAVALQKLKNKIWTSRSTLKADDINWRAL